MTVTFERDLANVPGDSLPRLHSGQAVVAARFLGMTERARTWPNALGVFPIGGTEPCFTAIRKIAHHPSMPTASDGVFWFFPIKARIPSVQ
jgi:hypothetical protein